MPLVLLREPRKALICDLVPWASHFQAMSQARPAGNVGRGGAQGHCAASVRCTQWVLSPALHGGLGLCLLTRSNNLPLNILV